MRQSIIVMLLLLLPVLSACGALAESVPALPAESESVEVAFVTASPTSPPTDTPVPTFTPTPVVEPTAVLTDTSLPTATPSPEPTLPPTDTPTPEPTATSTPEPDWLNSVGRTEHNLVYLGNPAAPVTLIDYSDFL